MFKIINGQHVNTNQITRVFGTSKGLELLDEWGQESLRLYYVITIELSSGSTINTDIRMQNIEGKKLIEIFKEDKPSEILHEIIQDTLQDLVDLFIKDELGYEI